MKTYRKKFLKGMLPVLCCLLSAGVGEMNVCAAQITGADGNSGVTGEQGMTAGTPENPVVFADGSGEEFGDWADGILFSPDCRFMNLTGTENGEIVLRPVYKAPVY